MNILVFGGSGKMGAAVAWDLVQQTDVETVGLVGRQEESLARTRDWIGNPKVKIHPLDIQDVEATAALMAQYDVGVSTLPDRNT
ncbi:MAG TPA: saccharopine dehydrogenase NADP-binding domain-containing protein, partial [Anaerolineales bacterium]|nr:saccharopine dehydrogenase NADP-binding domain-containing protein [Anaerolineales bacterium]